MPFPNFIGSHNRLWTKENVILALQKFANENKGPLPRSDHAYNKLKKGHLDWPTSHRILEYFGTMSRAWLAAGMKSERVSLNYCEWTESEILYLKENTGNLLIREMANALRRSYAAVRRELYELGITSRGNQGHFSAALLAKEYGYSYDRLLQFLHTGKIPANFCPKRHRWLINLDDITPEAMESLKKRRITHNTWPIDKGDYYQRHNIHRHLVDGKIIRVEEKAERENK
jgi:hypothetical protein